MKKCLIVVDYQEDFVTGSLGFAKARELEERIAEKIRQYHAEEESDVVFTLDTQDLIFCKATFGSERLYEYLTDILYDEIELVGVVTNICVISNAVLAKTAQPETEIIVDASCVASNDEELNEAALKVMESLQITVINRE